MSRAEELLAKNEERNRHYQDSCAQLAKTIVGWYRKETPSRRRTISAPSQGDCLSFAQVLLAIKAAKPPRDRRSDNLKKIQLRVKQLNKALSKEREAIEEEYEKFIADHGEVTGCHDENFSDAAASVIRRPLLSCIDETQTQIETLLLKLGATLPRDRIHDVADAAIAAWGRAAYLEKLTGGSGRISKAKNAHDPLCHIIAAALDWLGYSESNETISAVLKGRRRNKEPARQRRK